MEEFITCNRCEKIIDMENDGGIKYEKKGKHEVVATLYMCIDCFDELMYEDEK